MEIEGMRTDRLGLLLDQFDQARAGHRSSAGTPPASGTSSASRRRRCRGLASRSMQGRTFPTAVAEEG
ncbi:hypothetical protein ACFXPB_12025 [Streptomyces sp. NPDC059129]